MLHSFIFMIDSGFFRTAILDFPELLSLYTGAGFIPGSFFYLN
jgi:hypothetical protein